MARAAVGVLAAFLVAGCSVSVGSPKAVSKEEVAKQASAALSKKIGREIDDVTCEDDLKAEAGETTRCELTVGGQKLGMTATATSVDDDKVKMDFKVDDAPDAGGSAAPDPSEQPSGTPSAGSGGGAQTVDRAEVARQGKAALTAQTGQAPDAFSCPQDLPARVNATIRCQLAADGKQYGVTVTATSVVNGNVKMNFQVDSAPNG
ncbi:DUF4333 domain-containing protein [Streptomyces fimicarius]|uniref:DUF4333 domain-containing protein n=1 Tax=Streptomyces TaxID=1883 RepID=UPI0004AB18BB|nr:MULTISPECIES: DUF4333 domain-containing protein [Streptomyces]MCL6290378.1 DUF4333 domain-containing protein [Streptomyces sp. 43Y-GA-1]MCX4709517.1 DUF4333 domain-containing protein [Streptomyces griseus]MDX2671948.1 DUF4333 domain-containing protein [Streptomyces sp. NRRL_ISP-5395]MDX3593434.1 DUF4333 domain-containing protein [Streptomyces sp. ID03-2B]QXQ97485.1 DUF4333 domain-containing protein [Streptomyces sp. WY228]